MGLTVCIGVGDWFWEEHASADHEAFLRELVRTGCTDKVRDVVNGVNGRDSIGLETQVYEAWRTADGDVDGRYLDAPERRPIIEALLSTYEEWDTYAGFSWDHLEEVGAWDVQTVNLVMDTKDTWEFRIDGAGSRHSIRELRDSVSNWAAADSECAIARALCSVAMEHRLVVKSI